MPKLDNCEVCGRETNNLIKRKIEGVIMNVCRDCQELGEEPDFARKAKLAQRESQNKTQSFNTLFQGEKARSTPSGFVGRSNNYIPHPRPAKKKDEEMIEWKVVMNAPVILAKIRNDHKLTLEQFANLLGVKENYYRNLEKGTMAMTIDLARRIEKKYQVTLLEKEDIMDENEDLSQYLKDNRKNTESVVYFRKRGQKPEYEQ